MFEETRNATSHNHTSAYASYGKLVVDIKVFKICRPQHSGSAWCRQRVCHSQCTVLAALSSASVCLCLFLALHVVYLPIYATLWLVVGMTKQMSDGKDADIVNC